jgi:purine-binding chemotaxis protein CheW
MLAHAGQPLGLKVDAVGELIDSGELEIAPPPPGRASRDDDPVSGVLPWRDGFVALLDARRLYRLDGGDGDVA